MDITCWIPKLSPNDVYALAAAAAIVVLVTAWARSTKRSLAHIPTVGYAGTLTSYRGALQYLFHNKKLIAEGYYKYKGSAFKVASFKRWVVIVNGPQAVEDIRQAADDELSFAKAAQDFFAFDYTLGPNIESDPYHIPIIRNQLTKNLGILFPEIRGEVIQAFEDEIPLTADWTKVPALKTVRRIVSRTSNRVFVGPSLCRNSDWLALNIEFTIDVVKAATIIRLFPNFLKPIVGRLLTNVPTQIRRGLKHMVPVIEDRQGYIGEYGKNWDGKPDMLSWLMDEASPAEMSARNLTLRMMSINFVAIHTSSMAFTHALYHLAAMPHYIQPMREEVEAVVNKEGWTKSALSKFHKVDSFLKEAQRLDVGSLNMTRIALKDFTFTDGTFIPKGTNVSIAAEMHRDENNYANPEIFDGFRFADMGLSAGDSGKYQMVATSPDHLVFGHGRHACPGRFFAANELKMMMAHLVLTYDVKLENEGVRPPNQWFASVCVPNEEAEVLFRKRKS